MDQTKRNRKNKKKHTSIKRREGGKRETMGKAIEDMKNWAEPRDCESTTLAEKVRIQKEKQQKNWRKKPTEICDTGYTPLKNYTGFSKKAKQRNIQKITKPKKEINYQKLFLYIFH